MKRLASCLVLLMLPAAAFAQDSDANINLLVTPPSYSGCADPQYDFIDQGDCEILGGTGASGPVNVWVVYSHQGGWANGVGGGNFGITHDLGGIGWTLCTGGQEIPETGWPATDTGEAITWAGGCYNPPAGNARVGFFALGDGSTGNMALRDDPRSSDAKYVDCSSIGSVIPLSNLGSMDLSGDNPPLCGPQGTPVREMTWSQLKSLY